VGVVTRRSSTPLRAMEAFLRANYGKRVLAPLTGQDHAALATFANALDGYTRADGPGQRYFLLAMWCATMCMQRSTRPLAWKGVPSFLDWPDEFRLQLRAAEAAANCLDASAGSVELLRAISDSRTAMRVAEASPLSSEYVDPVVRCHVCGGVFPGAGVICSPCRVDREIRGAVVALRVVGRELPSEAAQEARLDETDRTDGEGDGGWGLK
jgi:hypothetical protein